MNLEPNEIKQPNRIVFLQVDFMSTKCPST